MGTKHYRVTVTYVVCLDAKDEKDAANRADDFVTNGCDGDGQLVDCGADVDEVES
jgi:hypothetical protein